MRLDRRLFLIGLVSVGVAAGALGHPLPDTMITISGQGAGLRIEIVVPAKELQLVLPGLVMTSGEGLTAADQQLVHRYFGDHLAVLSREGEEQNIMLDPVRPGTASDPHVGTYEVLRLAVGVVPASGFDPTELVLRYDAILHEVANHAAMVFRINPDGSRAGAGRISYDITRKQTEPLKISLR